MPNPNVALPRLWTPFTYIFMAAAAVAQYQMNNAGAIVWLAVLTVGLTGLLFADFSKLRVGGTAFGVEAERQAGKVEAALVEAAEASALPIPELLGDEESTGEGAPHPATETKEGPSKLNLDFLKDIVEQAKVKEAQRRRAIERLMTEAAEWGFTLSKQGYSSPVLARVEWGENGIPRLEYGEHPPPSSFWRARVPTPGEPDDHSLRMRALHEMLRTEGRGHSDQGSEG